MPPLPILKPRQVAQALQKAGFIVKRQSGSHAQFIHTSDESRRVTVPMHSKDIPRGTLRNIIRQSGMRVDEFLKYL